MVAWDTVRLPVKPDAMSPGGVSEIRHLISHDYGDLTHVRVPAGGVSAPAWLDVAEFFYVWAGWGQLWRKCGVLEDVVDLRPGTCASVLPGSAFQYRAEGGPTASPADLVIVLAVVPRWSQKVYHHADVEPKWVPTHRNGPLDPPPEVVGAELGPVIRLPANWDTLAPDGSEIRSLVEIQAAGIAHCQLAPGLTSTAVHHRTVSETWFVLDGAGELWRSAQVEDGLRTEITPLAHGVSVDIPLGTTFQFRSTGKDSLQLLLLTAPRWPGPDEAVEATQQWEHR